MTVRRAFLGAGVALGTSLALPPAAAQVTDIGNAINKAGRLRALSQRLTKAYASMGLGIEVDESRRIMQDSVAVFDRFLVELRAYAPNASLREHYASMDPLWSEVKTIVLGAAPSREGLVRLKANDEQVLAAAHEGTLRFQRLANRPGAELVNVAGRQRMLSQRVAKFHFSALWGVDKAGSDAQSQRAREEFLAAMQTLQARASTDLQRNELQVAQAQWVFFEGAMRGSLGSTQKAQQNMLRASELILLAFDDVTRAFERSVGA